MIALHILLKNVHLWFSLFLQVEGNDRYVNSGPPFLIFLHPSLGPLWEVTRQKVSLMQLVLHSIVGCKLIFPYFHGEIHVIFIQYMVHP